MTVTPRGLANCPVIPVAKTMGRNTITLVKVEAVIAILTSVEPMRAASFLSFPSCRCRNMFSRTTMELSRIMPILRARPLKVIMLRV